MSTGAPSRRANRRPVARAPKALPGGGVWGPNDVDFMPIGVNHVGLEGEILAANPAFAQMLGYDPDQLIGRSIRDLHWPEDPAFLPRLFEQRRRLHQGEIDSINVQVRYRRKDGSPVWTEASIAAARDERGQVLYDISAVVDISERKLGEARLVASEQRYRSLIGLAAEWYWEQDENYRLTHIENHTARAAQMNALGQMNLGKAQWELDYLNMTEADWTAYRARLDARETFQDLRLKRVAQWGRPIWLSMSGHPVYDDAGRFTGYRGITLDISERVRAEQLQNLEHEVAAALSSEEDAERSLERVLRIVCESDDWDCGRYFLLEEVADVMRFGGSWAIPDEQVAQFIDASRNVLVERGRGISGRVWESGRPLWTDNIASDQRAARNPLVMDIGIRGVFVFPIMADGRPIGLVSLGCRRPRQPDERLMRAADALGRQIGQFISRRQAEEALRLSEERFRGLVQLSSDFYWEQDAELRFVTVSGQTGRMKGINALVKLRRWEVPGNKPLHSDWDAHRAVVESHRPFRDFEYEFTDASGERSYLSVSGEPLFDAEGRFTGYRGTGKDITERIRTEQMQHLEHAVAAALARATDESNGVTAVIRTLCEAGGWDCARYAEPDLRRGVLRFFITWGIQRPEVTRFLEESRDIEFPLGYGLAGAAWEKAEPVWSQALPQDPRVPRHDLATRAGFRSGLAFAALSADQPVGVVVLFRSDGVPVDERLLSSVRTIGSQLGQFLHRLRAERALQESNERFNVAVRATSDVIWDWDLVADTLTWNDNFGKVFGYPPQGIDASSRSWYESIHPEDHARVLDGLHRAIGTGASHWSDSYRFRRHDGRYAHVIDRGEVLRDATGKPVRMIGAMTDTTERTEAEQRIRRQADQQSLIAEFGRQALASRELDGVLQSAVPLIANTLSIEYCDVLLFDETGQLVIKACVGRADDWAGRVLPVEPGTLLDYSLAHKEPVLVEDFASDKRFSRTPRLIELGLRSGLQVPIHGPERIFGLLSAHAREQRRFGKDDVSFMASLANILAVAIERKNAEERLAHLARYDSLTGLPNRHLFQDRLVVSMAQARRNERLMAVLFIDLDRFKLVNDTLGHAAGDLLLKEAAVRLNECVRSSDTVGRLGGDEFSAILSELAKPGDASLVAQKIVDALARPFDIQGHETYVSASIGITVFPLDGDDAGALVMNADTAMYRAKEQGRNNYQYFTPEMNERALARVQLESQLRRGMENDEFELHYQPRVDLASGAICGFEALLRWRHPQRGLLLPGLFIPVLEDTGLIVPIGEWVMGEACRQIVRWQRHGLEVPPVAVNLSARQFQQKDLEASVRRMVRESGVDPTLLQFEITESLLMQEPESAARILRGLRDSGVKLSVDDFGTGYSSLAYLKRFPIDALKIDREFIRDIVSDADDAAITRAIVTLGHSLGLRVVAEGVENGGQLEFLRASGCDEMQGFLFSAAADAVECEAMLRERRQLGSPAYSA